MSEFLQHGSHPDADLVSAFVEGMLPEHERLECLAHFAECARCREMVFLAQEPAPLPPVHGPAPVWWRWPVLGAMAAAAVCALVLAGRWYLHPRPGAPEPEIVAHIVRAPAVPIRSAVAVAHAVTPTERPIAPQRGRLPQYARRFPVLIPHFTAPPTLPEPPSIPALSAVASGQQLPFRMEVVAPVPLAPAGALSGISGKVVDPSGAVVPGVSITLRPFSGASTKTARTDATGEFQLSGLPPGKYELQASAPGFRRETMQIDLHSEEIASVNPKLQLGATTESVEVTAAPATLEASSASVRNVRVVKVRPLPSKLAAITTVVSRKVMLALDSAGTIFYSGNSGQKWRTIKPVWRGTVDSLIQLPDSDKPARFQLTTDSGSEWLSRDGSHWYPAPSQR